MVNVQKVNAIGTVIILPGKMVRNAVVQVVIFETQFGKLPLLPNGRLKLKASFTLSMKPLEHLLLMLLLVNLIRLYISMLLQLMAARRYQMNSL